MKEEISLTRKPLHTKGIPWIQATFEKKGFKTFWGQNSYFLEMSPITTLPVVLKYWLSLKDVWQRPNWSWHKIKSFISISGCHLPLFHNEWIAILENESLLLKIHFAFVSISHSWVLFLSEKPTRVLTNYLSPRSENDKFFSFFYIQDRSFEFLEFH